MWLKQNCFCLLILLFNNYLCSAQLRGNNNGECSIQGLGNIDWTTVIALRIPDNTIGIIKSYLDEKTVKSITTQYDDNCKDCMNIYYKEDNTSVNIELLNNFLHFEETLPSVFTLFPKTKIICQDESELEFRIDLEDVNDHDPEFLQIKDTVTLPMPITKNVNVGELNNDFKITASDIDFKNHGIDFKIEPDEYFDVSTNDDGNQLPNKKIYTAVIKTKQKMNIHEDYKIKITATDKPDRPGDPPRSVSREITIKVDEQNSILPTPVFAQPLYKGLYEVETQSFNIINGPIQLKENYKTQKSHLNAENGLFQDAFTLNDDFSITLNHKLEEDQIKDLNYIILYVTTNFISENADDKTEGKTVVLIDLKKPEPTTTTSTTEMTTTTTVTTTACPPCETTTVTSFTCPTTSIPEVTTSCPPCPSTPQGTTTSQITTEPNSCPTCPSCPTTPEDTTTSCPPCSSTPEATTTSHITTEPNSCPTCPSCSTTPADTTTGSSTPESTTTSHLTTQSNSCPTCPPCSCSTVSEGTTTSHLTTESGCSTCPTCSTETTLTTCEPCSTTCEPCTTCIPCVTTHEPCPTTCEPCTTCTPCVTTHEPCPTTCEPCGCNSTQPSCPTPAPCDCPTTTVKPGTYLKYNQDEYKFDQTDDFYGLLQKIEATSSQPDEKLSYDFDIDEPTVKSSISYGPNDPDLKINAKIPSGEYNLILHATGRTTNNKAKTNVLMRISTKQTCDENGSYKFPSKLIIKHVMENHHKDYLQGLAEHEKYKLEILNAYPPEFESVFFINETDGSLNMEPVDREDKLFEDFLVAQVQVELKATPKTAKPINKRESIPARYGWILTDNIDNENDKMILNIIIDDENDNKPIFEKVKNPLILGYPSSDFSNVAPPYLIKVTATDKDIGDNGRVSYFISGNDNFQIDSNQGIITLTKNAFMNTTTEEFIVKARDHGKPQLSSDDLNIKVKLLKKEHISVITVDDLMYSDIDKFFEDLNNKLRGTVLDYLSVTPVLSIENKTKILKNNLHRDANTQMRIVIYAIGEDEELLETEDTKKIIEENVDNDVDIENIQDSPLNRERNETNCDETGWIVAVSILAVAFVAAVIAIVILYLKYIRGTPNLILETKPQSSTTFEKNKDAVTSVTKTDSIAARRPTGFPKNFDSKLLEDDDEDDEEGKQEDKEQNEIIINDNVDPTTDPNTKSGVDNPGLEPDDVESGSKEDKNEGKKVVFNEEVEEIHITVL